MQTSTADISFTDDPKSHRFELVSEGKTAFIDYSTKGDVVTLLHTEVPKELEGQGVGTKLVEQTFHYLEKQNKKIVPLCSFVFAYLRRNPKWKKLIATPPYL